MNDRLKELMLELGYAINESIDDSGRISKVVSDIKDAGYEVSLRLEATIAFHKRDEAEDESEEEPKHSHSDKPLTVFEAGGEVKLTTQDHKFLNALKISIDDPKP